MAFKRLHACVHAADACKHAQKIAIQTACAQHRHQAHVQHLMLRWTDAYRACTPAAHSSIVSSGSNTHTNANNDIASTDTALLHCAMRVDPLDGECISRAKNTCFDNKHVYNQPHRHHIPPSCRSCWYQYDVGLTLQHTSSLIIPPFPLSHTIAHQRSCRNPHDS